METHKFKVLIFGNGGVGKTCLINRFLTGSFIRGAITIGVDFHIKMIDTEGKKVTLLIWDFAGEQHFRFLLPSYAEGSHGGIFMFDLTRFSSLDNIHEWLTIFGQGLKRNNEGEIPLIMVGSKLDLELERIISHQEAEIIARKHKFYDYIECSSKNGKNVEEIFIRIARIMMEKAGLI